MTRLTTQLFILAALVTVLGLAAQATGIPETGADIIPRITDIASLLILPLLGAAAAFGTSDRTGGHGRLIGWTGVLVVAVITAAALILHTPALEPLRRAALPLLNADLGAVGPLDSAARATIAFAAGTWVALLSIGLFVGRAPSQRRAGWAFQWLAGVAAAAFLANDLLYPTAPNAAFWVIAALPLFAITSLQLSGSAQPGTFALWCSAAGLTALPVSYVNLVEDVESHGLLTSQITIAFIAPFLMLALLMRRRGIAPVLEPVACLGLLAALMVLCNGVDGQIRPWRDVPHPGPAAGLAAGWLVLVTFAALRRPSG